MKLDASLPYERIFEDLVAPERHAQWRRRSLLIDAMIVRCRITGSWDRARDAQRLAERARDLHMAEVLGLVTRRQPAGGARGSRRQSVRPPMRRARAAPA